MNKKGLAVLILAALAAGGAFAQPDFRLSAGAGGYFGGQIGGGITASMGGVTNTTDVWFPNPGYGGLVFLDATYAELSIGFGGGGGYIGTQSSSGSGSGNIDYNVTTLNIGLLGKYPFQLSPKFALFPLLGIDYLMVLNREYDKTDDRPADPFEKTANGDFNAFSFKLGVGFDVSFTDQIYLRFSTVLGLQLPNKFTNDRLDDVKKTPGVSAEIVPGFNWDMAKLAVGFRF